MKVRLSKLEKQESDLNDKIVKLSKFMHSSDFTKLDWEEIHLIQMEHGVLITHRNIIMLRVKLLRNAIEKQEERKQQLVG